MGLLDRIAAIPTGLPGPACSIGSLITSVTPDQAADIRRVIEAKQSGELRLTWRAIADAINVEHHVDINAGKLSHHARSLCSCGHRGMR